MCTHTRRPPPPPPPHPHPPTPTPTPPTHTHTTPHAGEQLPQLELGAVRGMGGIKEARVKLPVNSTTVESGCAGKEVRVGWGGVGGCEHLKGWGGWLRFGGRWGELCLVESWGGFNVAGQPGDSRSRRLLRLLHLTPSCTSPPPAASPLLHLTPSCTSPPPAPHPLLHLTPSCCLPPLDSAPPAPAPADRGGGGVGHRQRAAPAAAHAGGRGALRFRGGGCCPLTGRRCCLVHAGGEEGWGGGARGLPTLRLSGLWLLTTSPGCATRVLRPSGHGLPRRLHRRRRAAQDSRPRRRAQAHGGHLPGEPPLVLPTD